MYTEIIRDKLIRNNIVYRDNLPEKLNIYLLLLEEWNQKIDLTSVSDAYEMTDKHFIDSLAAIKAELIRENASLIDVGTGAGFPGMVLAMARPDLRITLMDSQQKRLNFLEAVADAADVRNVNLVHARAEDGARKAEMREKFDYATARALAPLNILCEYLLPYAKVDGYALCWKGPALKDEIENGRKAAFLLGGRLEMPVSCHVEGREWEHVILPIHKVQHTASLYPRKAGIPKNKPLGC